MIGHVNDTTPRPAGVERRLVRPGDDRVIAGVCAGVGRYLGIDPSIVRIAVAVLTVMGGSGVLLYGIGWLAIPDEGDRRPIGEHCARRFGRSPIGLVILAVIAFNVIGGAFAFGLQPGSWGWGGRGHFGPGSGGILVPLVLIGVGVMILRSRAGGPSAPPGGSGETPPVFTPPPPAPAGVEAAHAPAPAPAPEAVEPAADPEADAAPDRDPLLREADELRRRMEAPFEPAEPVPAAPPSGVPSAPRPWARPEPELSVATPFGRFERRGGTRRERRPRSLLGVVTVGLLLIGGGALWLADQVGVVDVHLDAAIAAALLLVGVMLLVGTWFGRSRFLIFLGLLLTVALTAATAIDVPLTGSWGDRTVHPVSAAALHPTYRIAGGQLVLDLTDLRVQRRERVEASVGFGKLLVLVPPDVNVHTTAHVTGGEIVFEGARRNGFDVRDSTILRARTETSKRLDLDLGVAFGQVEVQRG